MAPKQKFKGKKPKTQESELKTENDYLEAADENEKAAGKWRAGEAAKAIRFYYRAIAAYDEGLKMFPRDFDLAYNKAHLQYSMTEDAHIAPHLGPPIDLLKETLLSHRYALSLDSSNADVLFNTAQVLTSLAEKLSEAKNDTEARQNSISLLHEAVELFSSCLTKQELDFEEFQALRQEAGEAGLAAAQQQQSGSLDEQQDDEEPEEWVAVVEAVTPSTLIESALAQLSSLTTLISVSSPAESSTLARISELGANLIQKKLPSYMALLPSGEEGDQGVAPQSTTFLSVSASSVQSGTTEQHAENPLAAAMRETQLASALFHAALADAEYRSKLSSATDYSARLKTIFEPLIQAEAANPAPTLLCAFADALMDYVSSLTERDSSSNASAPDPETSTLCWTALTLADSLLASALKTLSSPAPAHASAAAEADAPSKSSIYLLRGDVELQRRRLALAPSASRTVADSVGVLLRNAGVYYRGAAALALREQGQQSAAAASEAQFKTTMVRFLEERAAATAAGGGGGGGTGTGGGRDFDGIDMRVYRERVEELIEEGLVEDDVKEMLG